MHKLAIIAIFVLNIIIFPVKTLEFSKPIVRNHTIGHTVNGTVNSSTELTYWFTGNVTGKLGDLTINVDCSVGDNASVDTPVRFDVTWKDVIEQPTGTWVLPRQITNHSKTIYKDFNTTLCSDINRNYTEEHLNEATVKMTVWTTSLSSVDFRLRVYFGESNVISGFRGNDPRMVDLTLFSPVFFKLKFNESVIGGLEFAVLDIWSNDFDGDICVTVALRPPECPLIQRETDAEMKRHLTMSSNASVTIKTSDLLDGRFLFFVINENDDKCRSDQCDGCWKNEILPTASVNLKDSSKLLRKKRLYFTIKEKITFVDYYLAMGLTVLIELAGSIILFIIAFYATKRLDNENEQDNENVARNQNLNHAQNEIVPGYELDNVGQPLIEEENQTEDIRRFWIFVKKTGLPPICNDCRNQNTNQYFGTLIVLATFYILPAVQLMWVYQRFYKISGNEDICFFNFRCLHTFWGSPAFNHLFSNIGYIFMGLVFILVVLVNKSNKDKGIFVTMGFSLMVQGIMSALYHDCPNQISFQFDTSFMYITAVLLVSHIYQKQHPGANANAVASYVVVAIAVVLGFTAVVSRVKYFWYGIVGVHVVICLLVSCQLDSIHGGYTWKLASPRNVSCQDIKSSFTQPLFSLESFSWVKSALVLFNLLNWLVAVSLVIVWIIEKSQDFATYLLALFILNLVLFSSVYVVMKIKDNSLPMRSSLILLLPIIAVWITAGYFYLNHTSSWSVSPAESRTSNQDCILFDFYDAHDIWHFLSAFGMFLNFLLFFIMDGRRPGYCGGENLRVHGVAE